jgi:probable HAF family extracellular repeat protein
MRTGSIIARALSAAFALSITAALAQVPATKYVVTDLGSLDGSIGTTSAQGINNAGQVVGSTRLGASFSDPSRAFRTAPNRPIQAADNLGTLGGASSFAYAINSAGQVVGDADTALAGPFASVVRRAFRADPGQPMIDLGTLAPSGGINGFNNSGARSISDQAVVVGLATVPNNICLSASRAFRTAPGALINPATDDLGTLVTPTISCPSLRSSIAWGVNGAGTVVGNSATTLATGTPNHAFHFTGAGPMQDLGVLGLGPNSTAFAVNDRGEAVGESQVDGNPFSGTTRAFLKAGSNPLLDLGDLGGGWASAAAINTPLSGGPSQVVGRSGTAAPASHGFVWTGSSAGGTMIDLNARIAAGSPWEITYARAINGRGQIVADALKDGVAFVYRAVRLDPSDVATDILLASLSDPALALTQGQINALSEKVINALQSIQAGLNKQAINQLNAFVSAVQTQWKGGKMSSATAANLTDAANAIIAALK